MCSSIAACLPGEFETQAALMLGCNELLPVFPQVMVDVVDALIDRIPLVGIVDSEEQRRHVVTLLCDWGLPAHLMHFVFLPVRGMWVRDYGPSFVRQADGRIVILDAQYTENSRRMDDLAPTELAALLKIPVIQVPLIVEGGNLLSNGQRVCLTTETIVQRNAQLGHDQPAVHGLLKRYYGFDQVVTLHPLAGEATAHVEVFASFVSPDVVVLGSYDPAVDATNAAILDENARILSTVRTRLGPLRVVRIPMPPNVGGVWRSYTNVIYANGTLLMPIYPDIERQGEKRATQVYADLLPGWEIVGIDASAIVLSRGGLHSLSINIPWLSERFPSPDRFGQQVTSFKPAT